MLKRTLIAFALVAMLLLLLIAGWQSSLIPTYAKICSKEAETCQEKCTTYHIVLVTLWQVGKFLDEHNGFFSALFAGVVATFTWRLYIATAALADAERPHMLPVELKIDGIRSPPIDGNIRVRFTYRFINYGRSPAFMKNHFFGAKVGDLPPAPKYGLPTPTNIIIGVSGWYAATEPAGMLVSVDDTAKILAGTTSFFIYGYIEYSDTARKDHKIRFAYNFDWGEGGESIRFRPDGPDSYREYT